jgi:hypothetical protein
MTVKILTAFEKDIIQADFTRGLFSINDMVDQFDVSRRTIIRVLEEGGIDPGIRRRKPKAPVQTNLEPLIFPNHAINPENIPWYQRYWNKFCAFFNVPCYAQDAYH